VPHESSLSSVALVYDACLNMLGAAEGMKNGLSGKRSRIKQAPSSSSSP
jgi:hypothetical protein